MRESDDARLKTGQILIVGGLFVAVFGLLSIGAGQDANWDLKNYHLYNAYQLLQGRLWLDLNAAGMQSFFNPLLDLPYYVLSAVILADYPRSVAFIMGLPNAALALSVTWIAFLIFRSIQDISFVAIAAAIYIGISGGISISELGTTFNDIPPAALVLFGLAMALHAISQASQTERRRAGCFIASGILFGAAAGLKLPSTIFAPAFVLALLLTNRPKVRTLVDIFCFCAGWGVGLLVIFGWWMLQVYILTGNPVFPVLNQIFRSDWYPPIPFFDERWRTRGMLQAIAFPFFWINRGHSVVTEVWYGDARFAAAYIAVLMLGAGALAGYLKRGTRTAPSMLPEPARFLIWFVVSGYLIWQITFCVARYAIALEALVGIPILAAVWMIASGLSGSLAVRQRLTDVTMVVVALFLQLGTHYPDWGRVAFGDKVFAVEAPRLPPNALVVISGAPNSYVIPYLTGENARFIGITNTTTQARGYGLWDETAKRIRSHDGPILVLQRTDGTAYTAAVSEIGLSVDGGQCTGITTNLDSNMQLCRAHRRP